MNKLQEQSLQERDSRFLTSIIDDGNVKDEANHATTHAMLDELLNRSGASEMKTQVPSFGGASLDRTYCNLFVIGGENFESGSFSIGKERVFNIGIEPSVKKLFFDLRVDSVVERILLLPSLFMSENVDYMRARPGQKSLFGRVTDLSLETNEIKISFEVYAKIFQQSITDISHKLGILGNPGCSELNNTHWTIKQVDLIKELTETGLIAFPTNLVHT